MNKLLMQLMEDAVLCGVSVDIHRAFDGMHFEDNIEVSFSGFGKSGNARVKQVGDGLVAYTRYGQEDPITSGMDLYDLHHQWWYNQHSTETQHPSDSWEAFYDLCSNRKNGIPNE